MIISFSLSHSNDRFSVEWYYNRLDYVPSFLKFIRQQISNIPLNYNYVFIVTRLHCIFKFNFHRWPAEFDDYLWRQMDEKTYKFIKINCIDYSDRSIVVFYFNFCQVFIFIQCNRNAAISNFQEKVITSFQLMFVKCATSVSNGVCK